MSWLIQLEQKTDIPVIVPYPCIYIHSHSMKDHLSFSPILVLTHSEFFLKFQKEVQGIQVGLYMEVIFFNSILFQFPLKITLR